MIKYVYGLMGSGKTEELINSKQELEANNEKVLLITFEGDNRTGVGEISSRAGKKERSDLLYGMFTNFETLFKQYKNYNIFIDEAQFLTSNQVYDIYRHQGSNNIVLFGILTDFTNNFFEGTAEIIKVADEIKVLKNKHTTKCSLCDNKAMINGRFIDGKITTQGEQLGIEKHGEINYNVICVSCFREAQVGETIEKIKEENQKYNNEKITISIDETSNLVNENKKRKDYCENKTK